MIIDPFHGGAILNELDCRELLKKHIGEDAAFEPQLLARTTRKQILIRMLRNLKGLYVRMHSFPQALLTTDALLALHPGSLPDLRDRGLLAYHMNEFSRALKTWRSISRARRLAYEQDEDTRKRASRSGSTSRRFSGGAGQLG
jgi:regulator of sirC expression with transglutaminase-like and TPR domain